MKKKIGISFIGFMLFIGIVILLNFIPTWNLRTKGMEKLTGEYVDVFYETEQKAAEDIFEYVNENATRLIEALGASNKEKLTMYIYDNQKTMQMKKYGFVVRFLNLDWYIGDNVGDHVILTSPANPGEMHDYESIKDASLHELVHAYIYRMNPKIAKWLTDGMALYLTNGEPFYRSYQYQVPIPSYKEVTSENPITFSNCGGYQYAHTYIEYLEKTYGKERVICLLQTEDYEGIFQKSQNDIYKEWVEYIKEYPI